MSRISLIILFLGLLFFAGCTSKSSTGLCIFDNTTSTNTNIDGLPFEKNEYMVTIQQEHFCNHIGKLFFYSDSNTLQVNQIARHFIYNDGNETHLFWEISAVQDSAFSIYEKPIASNNGTALTVRSYNRDKVYPYGNFKVWKAPTITNNGTLIYTRGIYAKNTYTTDRNVNEFILKKNTTYQIIYTSLANSNRIDMIGTFYNYHCIVD